MTDKLDAAARSLRELQSCAQNALTEKSWLKARLYDVAFGLTILALCIYCAVMCSSNHRAIRMLREACPGCSGCPPPMCSSPSIPETGVICQ